MEKLVKDLIEVADKNINNYLIIIVGNVKGITAVGKNFDGDSITSEYYSFTQYKDIIDALIMTGYEVKSYFDEIDFIHDYSLNLIRNNYPKKLLVINFAQKGTEVGRKSLIPIFCDINNILHNNCNAFVVSFAREKYHWYKLLKDSFSVAESWLYQHKKGWIFGEPKECTKVICKLSNESSSIGLNDDNIITFIKDDNTVSELSNLYHKDIIVQEFIDGFEVEIPFINNKKIIAFDPIGINIDGKALLGNKILTYDIRNNNKFGFYNYSKDNSELAIMQKKDVCNIASAMNIIGIGRIDIRVKPDGKYYITDINCNPHITKSMTIYYAMKELGFPDYIDTIKLIIGCTINRHPN